MKTIPKTARRFAWPVSAVIAATLAAVSLAGCQSVGGGSHRSVMIAPSRPKKPATLDPGAAVAWLSAYRARHGLPPVRLNPVLMAVARDHANKMAARDQLDHVLPGEGSFQQRVESHGYNAGIAAEDIGAGYPDLDTAFVGWRASPHHNANLLKPGVTEIGIAVAFSPKSRFGNFWSLVLAAPYDDLVRAGPGGGPPAGLFVRPR